MNLHRNEAFYILMPVVRLSVILKTDEDIFRANDQSHEMNSFSNEEKMN